jgi:hypothetical protein
VTDGIAKRFRNAIFQELRFDGAPEKFKEAARETRLSLWTRAMTEVAVRACASMGLSASAKGHKLDLLPVGRSEYLGMDVTAFPSAERRWRFPALVAELENSQRTDYIAYALWKVLCVKADLRAVFCYRADPGAGPALLVELRREVVEALQLSGRIGLEGDTLVVIGSRGQEETFPHGYFAWWALNKSTGMFERT